MSVFDISGVTVLVGLTAVGTTPTVTETQMTRRISKVVIHSKYNAATFVSFYKHISGIYLINDLLFFAFD
jgi:hypothetical protein